MPYHFDKNEPIFNVAYDKEDGHTFHYLLDPVTYADAQKWLNRFSERYVNKPYPNAKGFYKVTNPRIVVVGRQ